jgi:PKD repeat protein
VRKKMGRKILRLHIVLLQIMLIIASTMAGMMVFTWVSKESEVLSSTLSITAATNQPSYLLRQKVEVAGSMTLNNNPATNMMVIIQIKDPTDQGLVYRTLQIQNPSFTWPINITGFSLTDTSLNPINTVKINTDIRMGMTFSNQAVSTFTYFATLTMFDANFVPIATRETSGSIAPNQPISPSFQIHIPNWACSGKSYLVGNVYSSEPKTGGIALSLERTAYFCISRVQQGLLDYPTLPQPSPLTTPGVYSTQIGLPPDPKQGSYSVFVVGQASPVITSSAFTYFNVQSSSGYPPQASFAYWPAAPYQNQTVNFDASSSTPEGFNDNITKYDWSFGDGTAHVIKQGNPPDPTTTHQYLNTGTYVITLNVTDAEGLWCTTSKPITVYPEFGPTANFTYSPSHLYVNNTLTLDATGSTPGWSKQIGGYSPIINYNWNLGDGTIVDTSTPTKTYKYTQPGNYTVTLTVTDSVGRTSQASTVIQAFNVTGKAWDVNLDGKCDVIDILIVAKAYGSSPPNPPRADVDGNGKVDVIDILIVAKHYGQDP